MTSDHDYWRTEAGNRVSGFDFSNSKNLILNMSYVVLKEYVYIFVIQNGYTNIPIMKVSLLTSQCHLIEISDYSSNKSRYISSGYIDTNSFGFHGYKYRITANFSNRTVDMSLIQDSNNLFRAYVYIGL